MQSPVTSRPPSQGNRDVVGGVLSVGNAKQEIFSERPMTAKSVEQRFPLRPATSGMLRPTNRPFDGVPIIGRQTLVPSAIASLKGPGYTQQGQPPGPRGTIKPGSKLGAAEDKPISSVPAEHEVTVPKEHKRETEILQPKFDAQEPEVEMRFMDPTTNTLHFSMREMVPEIYQEMLDVSRSQQIDNRNFVSHYELGGDGFPMFWKNTTYGEANEQAAAAITDNSAAQDRSFINWVQRQKLYYGDVLTKEAQAQVGSGLLLQQRCPQSGGTTPCGSHRSGCDPGDRIRRSSNGC